MADVGVYRNCHGNRRKSAQCRRGSDNEVGRDGVWARDYDSVPGCAVSHRGRAATAGSVGEIREVVFGAQTG